MSESPDLFGDDLLSPLTEHQPLPGCTASLDPATGFTSSDISESKSMENILLESSLMDESIDLGHGFSAQSIATVTSTQSAENLGVISSELEPVPTPETQSGEEQETSKVQQDICEESQGRNMEEIEEKNQGPEGYFEVNNGDEINDDEKIKEVKDYFKIGTGQTDDVFASISIPGQLEDSVHAEELAEKPRDNNTDEGVESEPRVPSTRHIHVSVSKEEEVEFEEVKGAGLKPTMSTRSLTKFFSSDAPSDATGTDAAGKSFFDTFTASAGESASAVASSPRVSSGLEEHMSHYGGEPPSPAVVLSSSPGFPGIPSPAHQPPLAPLFGRQISTDSGRSEKSTGVPRESLSAEERLSSLELYPTPTPSLQMNDEQDPFTCSLTASDRDRRQDAWIPSDATRLTLRNLLTSPPGIFVVPPEQRTQPSLIMNDPQGDPVRDLVLRFMGEQEMNHRKAITADDVSQDEAGLHSLIVCECWRSAVDLTGRLLTQCGQGVGAGDQPCQHTPFSLKVWLVRISLLTKLHMYSLAETECQAFGSMDAADLYYEYYQDQYPGRRGSMVPFELRVLYAELAQYQGKAQETLDRLHYLLAIVNKILSNLEAGLAEDGSVLQLKDDSRKASKDMWTSRKCKLLNSVGNCALNIKDYRTAIDTFESVLEVSDEGKLELLSGIGRIYLQMGDPHSAKDYFDRAKLASNSNDSVMECRNQMNKGFLEMEQNKFEEAKTCFEKVVELQPDNAVAVNNIAVCWLYLGHLKEALRTLETLVHQQPAPHLHDGLLFNLCTLYELESSRAMHKKQTLLDLVNKNTGDGFNVACLKMT